MTRIFLTCRIIRLVIPRRATTPSFWIRRPLARKISSKKRWTTHSHICQRCSLRATRASTNRLITRKRVARSNWTCARIATQISRFLNLRVTSRSRAFLVSAIRTETTRSSPRIPVDAGSISNPKKRNTRVSICWAPKANWDNRTRSTKRHLARKPTSKKSNLCRTRLLKWMRTMLRDWTGRRDTTNHARDSSNISRRP